MDPALARHVNTRRMSKHKDVIDKQAQAGIASHCMPPAAGGASTSSTP
jgi:hypothetical protein